MKSNRLLVAVFWTGLVLSSMAAGGLVLRDLRARPARGPEHAAGVARPQDRSGPARFAAVGAGTAAASVAGPTGGEPAVDGTSPVHAGGPAAEDAKDAQEGEGWRPTPEEFIAGLIGMARKGEIDPIFPRLRPGFLREAGMPLMELVQNAKNRKEDETFPLDLLRFEYEDAGDGLVHLKVFDPGGEAARDSDFFLIPDGDSWALGTASDLHDTFDSGRRQAVERLRLLALSQAVYLDDDLDGDGPDFAASARELAEGLDRSPDYAGVLDRIEAEAIDAGGAVGPYKYGRIESASGFGYFAAPAAYGADSRETFIIDGSGSLWAKDLGGDPPPAEWPAEPEKAGWKPRKEGWLQ